MLAYLADASMLYMDGGDLDKIIVEQTSAPSLSPPLPFYSAVQTEGQYLALLPLPPQPPNPEESPDARLDHRPHHQDQGH
jgi:hypothetical protein